MRLNSEVLQYYSYFRIFKKNKTIAVSELFVQKISYCNSKVYWPSLGQWREDSVERLFNFFRYWSYSYWIPNIIYKGNALITKHTERDQIHNQREKYHLHPSHLLNVSFRSIIKEKLTHCIMRFDFGLDIPKWKNLTVRFGQFFKFFIQFFY